MLEPWEADAACSTPEPLVCNAFHVIPSDRDLQKARTEAQHAVERQIFRPRAAPAYATYRAIGF